MEDDERHSHLIAKESSRTRSQTGKDSSPHNNTHSQGKDPMHERESSVSEHKGQHPHEHQHHPHHPSAQPKTSTASTACT